MDVKYMLDNAIRELKKNDFTYIDEQARMLVAYVLDKEVNDIDNSLNDEISEEQYVTCQELLNKSMVEKTPVQFIIEYTIFNNMKFKVSKTSMLPDPVTELLVNVVHEYLYDKRKLNIIDIGTGVGVIAISIAKRLEEASIYATDISSEAIEIAKENCVINGVCDKVSLFENDLLKNIDQIASVKQFDAIVSNPPYVKSSSIAKLPSQVKDFSPIVALDGKEDGLFFYREILTQANLYLKNGGYIFFEYEKDIADGLESLIHSNSNYTLIEMRKNELDWGWVVVLQKKRKIA